MSFADMPHSFLIPAAIVGIFCIYGSFLTLISPIFWLIFSTRVQGKIIGAYFDKKFISCVYSYTLPDGEERQGRSCIKRMGLLRARTGDTVDILVLPSGKLRGANMLGAGRLLLGAYFASLLAVILYQFLTAFPLTDMYNIILLSTIAAYAKGAQRQMDTPLPARPEGSAPLRTLEDLRKDPQIVHQGKDFLRTQPRGILILLVLGSILLLLSCSDYSDMRAMLSHCSHAQGTVLRVDKKLDGTYHPFVGFYTKQGAPTTFQDVQECSKTAYKAGDAVKVLYMAYNPARSAAIDMGWTKWLSTGEYLMASLFLLCLALLCAEALSRQRKAA